MVDQRWPIKVGARWAWRSIKPTPKCPCHMWVLCEKRVLDLVVETRMQQGILGFVKHNYSQHKDQWRGALMFSLIWACIDGWINNREAGDLRRHRTHYGVTVMYTVLYTVMYKRWYKWTLLSRPYQRYSVFQKTPIKAFIGHNNMVINVWNSVT